MTLARNRSHLVSRGRWLWAAAAATALAACEPSPPPGTTSLLEVRNPSYTEEGVEGCHLCHAGDFNRSIADTPHGDVNNPAAPYAQHGCESCHGPGSFHVSEAHGGRGVPTMIMFGSGPKASSREEQHAVCLGCHGETAGTAAVAFAGTTHDLPIVTCSTCHTMHVQAEPLSEPARQAEICLGCHTGEREGHPQFGSRPLDFSKQACSMCHAIHR